MSMKKTDLEKNKMMKTMSRMKGAAIPGRFGVDSVVLDRKEQRKLDQAAGLVPFACKINGELITKLNAAAEKKKISLNELVAELLNNALK